MKWFECVLDCGDGSSRTLRFKTKESANAWLANQIEEGYDSDMEEFGCYPLGDLDEVDTDSKYFWSDLK